MYDMPQRVFIGLSVDSTLNAKLEKLIEPWKVWPVRLVPGHDRHLTLVPPRSMEQAQVAKLVENIKVVAKRHAPFVLSLNSIQLIKKNSHAQLIWLTGSLHPKLERLVADLNQMLHIEPLGSHYVMHVTLARVRSGEQSNLWRKQLIENVDFALLVEKITVYGVNESDKAHKYSVLSEVSL